MNAKGTRKTIWITLVMVISLGGVVWWQQSSILAWYYVRQLTTAYPENCEACAKHVASLDEAALPCLLEGLSNEDALVCTNLHIALGLIARKWGVADPRCQQMIERLHQHFDVFSLAGQEKTLQFLTSFLQQEGTKSCPSAMTREIGDLLLSAAKRPELCIGTLLLAAELLDCVPTSHWVEQCRVMAERGLSHQKQGTRVAAMQLLMREPMRKNKELLTKVLPLLRDPEAAVRRVAILVLASENEVLREDGLLPLLHDEDNEVRDRCEKALRIRGLTDDDIKLARLISDANPMTRLRVLQFLPQMPNLNLAEWLRQLSLDPSAAVRAAAVRAAGESASDDLAQRLREMAEQDPSETVRMNAQHYLLQRAPSRALHD